MGWDGMGWRFLEGYYPSDPLGRLRVKDLGYLPAAALLVLFAAAAGTGIVSPYFVSYW